MQWDLSDTLYIAGVWKAVAQSWGKALLFLGITKLKIAIEMLYGCF